MFLNILRISASNVLKMSWKSLNIIAGVGCAVVIFHSHKPTGVMNTLYHSAAIPWPATKQRNIKQKLYMYNVYNTRETKYFYDIVQYPK